jgi:hypothetical protein
MVMHFINETLSKEHPTVSNSEWGPEAVLAMSEEVRGLVAPVGKDKMKTVGDLIDLTPKDLISKVSLEEKVFKTWYSGRTVLLGDGTIHLGWHERNMTA